MLATVRCPKCGTVNPDGRRRLARCTTCHEAFGKCRYCLHYDPRQIDCTHPARRTDERILDADEVLNCPEFHSRLALGAPSRAVLRHLRPVVIGVAIGLGLMLGLVRLIERRPGAEVSLRISVSAPTNVFAEEALEIRVFVVNQSKQPAQDVGVRLVGRELSRLTCQSVEPPEYFEEASPTRVSARLGDLLTYQITTVLFRFTPNSTGKTEFSLEVSAANLGRPQVLPVACEIMP